ncbi:conserved hypothetical protein, membrane [Candidatus Omnitrophus magneticus]|uniref:Uncharacterized protein n=1 Tax=Candidatus Omnitrophus magneticus TaxID=1609969 RepID=A0A0F0CTS2_9BACT|nr:conserved hypothetical protein, membrane [Candidatus Omnitrophus magneticus]
MTVILLAATFILYYAHYYFFRDMHHILIYLLGDIAFVPVQVLLVTLFLDRILTRQEQVARLNKLNMVIGTFFSEVGNELLKKLSDVNTDYEKLVIDFKILKEREDKYFFIMAKRWKQYDAIDIIESEDFVCLKSFLKEKRTFLLMLLENPNLLEHESFTNLLWAVFHLTDEFIFRKDLVNLPEKDKEHLIIDMKRVYPLILAEWINYMKHLKKAYPYLYSMAVRTNPFDRDASIVVK